MEISEHYEALKQAAKNGLVDGDIAKHIAGASHQALRGLMRCDSVELRSHIPGKRYFVLKRGIQISRPVNRDLFDPETFEQLLPNYLRLDFSSLQAIQIDKLIYTLAMAYCAAVDLLGTGDKKTPATFFEYLVGNLFARELRTNPTNKLPVLNLGMDTTLPTDFLFDLGAGKTGIHLPVKLSTRERIVQAWAHQRVLDGVYGLGRFRGILVAMTETNIKRRDMSVVEVCLPDQWNVYQMFIARMHRVYYLDVPKRYEYLSESFPHIQVKPNTGRISRKQKDPPRDCR